MSQVIVITSGKGGVGKTTTTANIGTGLALLGYRVVLIDTDIGLRNLDVVMGLENRILYNLVDVLTGRCRMKQALIRDRRYPNLWIIPSSCSADAKNSLNETQMKSLLDSLRNEFDYILIDSPAGIDEGFRLATFDADHVVVVTTPQIAAIHDADCVLQLLERRAKSDIRLSESLKEEDKAGKRRAGKDSGQIKAAGAPARGQKAGRKTEEKKPAPEEKKQKVSLLVNCFRRTMVREGNMLDLPDICELLNAKLLGVILEDEEIIISQNHGEPVMGHHSVSESCYQNVARRLAGEDLAIPDYIRRRRLFSKILFGNGARKLV